MVEGEELRCEGVPVDEGGLMLDTCCCCSASCCFAAAKSCSSSNDPPFCIRTLASREKMASESEADVGMKDGNNLERSAGILGSPPAAGLVVLNRAPPLLTPTPGGGTGNPL